MGGGGTLPDFFFCSLFPVQQTTSGLATNTLNVKNNNFVFFFRNGKRGNVSE